MQNLRIYQIFVDRFSTGDEKRDLELAGKADINFMGGNLKGITKKLDYIKELGFNAIWLTPIYKTSDFHGYHVLDYYQVDERFGTLEDLRKLVIEAHKRGIKVFLDYVPNHVYFEHPLFQDAIKNPNSKYKDWFVWFKYPKEYMCFHTCWWLPKLNTKNPKVQEYLINVAKFYVEEFGVDGYRVDHGTGLAPEFLLKLKEELHKVRDDIIIFGECTVNSKELTDYKKYRTLWLIYRGKLWYLVNRIKIILSPNKDSYFFNLRARFYKEIAKYFDGLLDFLLFFVLVKKLGNYREIIDYLVKIDEIERNINTLFIRFIENHDFCRFYGEYKDLDFVRMGLLIIYGMVGATCFYYGGEIPMGYDKDPRKYKTYTDLELRKFMEWDKKPKLVELIKILNNIKERMVDSRIRIEKNNVGEKIGISFLIKTKNDEKYRFVVNPSPYHIELKEKYYDVELKNEVNRIPPFQARILKEE